MKKQVLFIHGGGDDGYPADAKLAASLQTALGDSYHIDYPRMPSDKSLPDFGWLRKIGSGIDSKTRVILVGHSLGASMLLKYLSETKGKNDIAGIFLIATPLWSGDEDWKKGLKVQDDFAGKLPKHAPVFLYHCRDDEEVPFDHLAWYAERLPDATVRELANGGHQLNNDLSLVASDISSLS